MIRIPSVSKTLASFVLCAALLLTPHSIWGAKTSVPFDDISRSYAKDAIVRLYHQQLIDGTGIRRFEPSRVVTRAEFITMLDRLFGIEPVASAIPAYADVKKRDWFYRWVQPSVQLGVAKGISDSRFEPGSGVTRQDAAVMLARALKQSETAGVTSGKAVYADQSQISKPALPSVLQLKKVGIMQGDGVKFRPKAAVTRQEAAVFMDRVWQHKGWAAQIRSKPAAQIQLGWQYGSTAQQFEQQVLQSNINTLSPRWFYLEKSGKVNSGVDPSLLTWAHQHGKKVWAMVGNRSNDALTHDMLSNEDSRKAAIASLTGEVKKHKIDGLNIDFENVSPQDRASLTLFIANLAKELHTVPATLSVDVSPELGTSWTKAFDYAALGASADYIVLMGYDEHWAGRAEAGSVSSLPWLQKGLETLLTQVPAKNVILGLPLYTRDWTVTPDGATAQDWSLVQQNETVESMHLTPTWDPQAAQYVSVYQNQNATHKLWLEDGRSLAAKVRLGADRHVAGYAYWYMGSETPDIWISLRNLLQDQHPPLL